MVKPEHCQCSGQCGQGEAHIGEGQHAQEVVHGLVQAWSPPHSEEDEDISSEGHCVHGGEGDGDPAMKSLHPWDATHEESRWLEEGAVEQGLGQEHPGRQLEGPVL